MIGGNVIGIATTGEESLVNLRGTGCERNDTIAVRFKHAGNAVNLGDAIWWQSGKCYWTPGSGPRCGEKDISLDKVGFSHSHAHAGASA